MNKAEFRSEMRRIASAADAESVASENAEIEKKLIKILSGYRCVFIYVSSGREIPTICIIEKLLSAGVRVCVPKTHDGCTMDAVEIKGLEELEVRRYNIPEPTGTDIVPPEDISAAVVPGLAFGRDFTRLGKGKGYYDRFLKRAGNAVRIAPCRKMCLADSVPHEPHDELMNVIITKDEILKDR